MGWSDHGISLCDEGSRGSSDRQGSLCLSYFHGSHILDVGAWTASTATKSVHPIPVVKISSFFQYLTTCTPPFIQKAMYKRNTGIFRKLQNASNFGQHGPLYRNWVSNVLSQVIIIFILKTIWSNKEIQMSQLDLSLRTTWRIYQLGQPTVVIRGMKKASCPGIVRVAF